MWHCLLRALQSQRSTSEAEAGMDAVETPFSQPATCDDVVAAARTTVRCVTCWFAAMRLPRMVMFE